MSDIAIGFVIGMAAGYAAGVAAGRSQKSMSKKEYAEYKKKTKTLSLALGILVLLGIVAFVAASGVPLTLEAPYLLMSVGIAVIISAIAVVYYFKG